MSANYAELIKRVGTIRDSIGKARQQIITRFPRYDINRDVRVNIFSKCINALDARDVSERYIAKSNPYIVMVSTPNAPDGLFEPIEKESEDVCLYKRIFLDYTYSIGKIYTIEENRKSQTIAFI